MKNYTFLIKIYLLIVISLITAEHTKEPQEATLNQQSIQLTTKKDPIIAENHSHKQNPQLTTMPPMAQELDIQTLKDADNDAINNMAHHEVVQDEYYKKEDVEEESEQE